MAEKYEDIFTGIYKQAKFLGGIEAEKLDIEEWRKRCQELYDKSKKAKEDIDKDIQKLSETKRLFWRIDSNVTKCDSLAYKIKDDCKEKPEKCPVEVKKLIIQDLEKVNSYYKDMLIREGGKSSLYEERINTTKELIEKMKK